MTASDKPIHGICVDKTSCRHEFILDKDGNMTPRSKTGLASQPTEHLTKDFVRKQYEQKQKNSGHHDK